MQTIFSIIIYTTYVNISNLHKMFYPLNLVSDLCTPLQARGHSYSATPDQSSP